MSFDIGTLSEEEISQRLEAACPGNSTGTHAEAFPEELFTEPPRPAAVLVPLLQIEQVWHVLFTRRTDTLPEHSGQVAFPGGRADPEDGTAVVTALREAHEEIGLEPQAVRILGNLAPFRTISNYLLTPVVGAIQWPFQLRLARAEVSRVFVIPLGWLAIEGNHEILQRVLPPPFPPVQVIYFKRYEGELLWGVSALIMLNLLKLLAS